jgi:RimJ/RimL family protein N-acetyltransferase
MSSSGSIAWVSLPAGPFVLRPPRESEAADALAMLRDPDTHRWNPAPKVVDLESAADWCRRGADWSDGSHATWSVVDTDERLVGNVSLWALDRDDQRSGFVGYRTVPWARGRGVATQGLAAATAWALGNLGLERLVLPHAVANPASCVIAERCGFTLEGVARAGYRDPDGERWDEHLHARLATDPVPESDR